MYRRIRHHIVGFLCKNDMGCDAYRFLELDDTYGRSLTTMASVV